MSFLWYTAKHIHYFHNLLSHLLYIFYFIFIVITYLISFYLQHPEIYTQTEAKADEEGTINSVQYKNKNK